MDRILHYFNGDTMAADAWVSKYQMKDPSRPEHTLEATPNDMHLRLAREFAEIEFDYVAKEMVNNVAENRLGRLSHFGQNLYFKRVHQTKDDIVYELFSYFKGFDAIVPQGSIMSNLGNKYIFGSLSNCFGIAPPFDSYGGIMQAEEHLVQLMKRRGGVGTHLNNIRPTLARVTNASKASTGVPTYAERYSNATREVAQEGRRGALMLLLSVKHPDIFRFVTMKDDRSKVTGANVSVMFTDKFMSAVEKGKDFICTFPVNLPFEFSTKDFKDHDYNSLYQIKTITGETVYIMKIRAKELFDTFVHMAHNNAEPGAAFIDTILDYSPDGVYEAYMPEVCNPCGEQWFHRNETCRLIAENLFGVVKYPFTSRAEIDFERLYEVSYMQQRIGDDLVDLEAIYIDRIIEKIMSDPEPMEVKQVELKLWQDIKDLALSGRRTGNGFTALGDMLAALGLPYASDKSFEVIEAVMKKKMEAELDATIDMAILRGPFTGWNRDKEFHLENPWLWGKDDNGETFKKHYSGKNNFFQMLVEDFPGQAYRMYNYGRRNVSWSTVAPTGTVSLMTQTTSGIEPAFKIFYIRRKKINPNDKDARIDFVDHLGDKWQEYAILHPKFKDWIVIQMRDHKFTGHDTYLINLGSFNQEEEYHQIIDRLTKDQIQKLFEVSPWYGSQAEDISWRDRIKVNSIVQRYTSNSISCTVNLPEDVSEETVHNLYFHAWKAGLKGITVYREGSRTGVLVSEVKQIKIDEFGYTDAVKRPETLEADYHFVKTGGKEFAVIVGKIKNNPYELFAFANPSFKENTRGKIVKVKSGEYGFKSENYTIENIQLADYPDERLICRFVSGMLRHGMNPKYIADQVDKSEINVVTFGKAVQRVLKAYVPDEESSGEPCPNCGETTIIYQEGCKRCSSCGYSKC